MLAVVNLTILEATLVVVDDVVVVVGIVFDPKTIHV